MTRNGRILHRFAIAAASVALTIVVGFQPAFSQAGIVSVITAEPPFTAGTFNSVTFEPSAIPGANAYEVCFFDSANADINGCAVLNPTGWDVLAADLEDVVEGRIYGCFIRAHYDQSGKMAYSDTVFLTWEAFSYDKMITNNAPKAVGEDDAAGAESVARAHNYPNPFNPKEEDTRIVFETNGSESITIVIYDLFGHLVYEKTDVNAGALRWEGRNGRGELVASGGYICVLKVEGKIVSKHKIAVIK